MNQKFCIFVAPNQPMSRVHILCLIMLILTVLTNVACSKKVAHPAIKAQTESLAQENTASKLFQEVNLTEMHKIGKQIPLPTQYKTFRLNTAGMRSLLNNTLADTISKGKKTLNITLPLPDGKLSTFRVSETSTMSPGLLVKYPKLRTYGGKGIDDLTATAKLDFMPSGFHAYIFTEKGSVIIQPYSEGDTINYFSYYKQNSSEIKQVFENQADSLKQNK